MISPSFAAAQLCYTNQGANHRRHARRSHRQLRAKRSWPYNPCSLSQKTRRAREEKKGNTCVASRPPGRVPCHTIPLPGGVTALEAHDILCALAEPSSTKISRRPRPRSANYSTLWLRLHLRLRLRTRTPALDVSSAPLPILAAQPRPGEYPGAPIRRHGAISYRCGAGAPPLRLPNRAVCLLDCLVSIARRRRRGAACQQSEHAG